MSTKRKSTKAQEAITGDFLLMCVQTTANFAKALQQQTACSPDLYESLRGLQLILERNQHKESKNGLNTLPLGKFMIQIAEAIERDIEHNLPNMTRDIMSETQPKILN